mmetsp:Transcript_26488/g.65792  ORF Transcript_26488/g.65792 Transcript_26488/m.65792 type:complete len:91 (+) Transcript_26488:87-359(+)
MSSHDTQDIHSHTPHSRSVSHTCTHPSIRPSVCFVPPSLRQHPSLLRMQPRPLLFFLHHIIIIPVALPLVRCVANTTGRPLATVTLLSLV